MHAGMVEMIVAPLQRRGRREPARGREHDVQRTDLTVVTRQPLLHRRGDRATEPSGRSVRLPFRELGRIGIGEHVSVSREGNDREHTVVVGRKQVRSAVGGRKRPGRGSFQDGGEGVRHAADDTRVAATGTGA